MHELTIAENLLEILKKEKKNIPGKFKSATISIGKLSGVSAESLNFYFEILKENTEFNDVKLYFDYIPLITKCSNCGLEFFLEEPIFVCKSCKGVLIPKNQGNELIVKSIEIVE